MELPDVMRTTGAVRTFTGRPVPDETLYRILDHARFAPSGGNQQAWRVMVVEDRQLRRSIADLCDPTWQRYMAESSAGYRPFNPRSPAPPDTPALAQRIPNPVLDGVEDVPRLLVVAIDVEKLTIFDKDLDRTSIIGGASTYPFVHNILLASRNEGFGAVLMTFLAAKEPEARTALHLPDNFAIAATIAIGQPTKQVTRLSRNPVESFTTIDTYDGAEFAP